MIGIRKRHIALTIITVPIACAIAWYELSNLVQLVGLFWTMMISITMIGLAITLAKWGK